MIGLRADTLSRSFRINYKPRQHSISHNLRNLPNLWVIPYVRPVGCGAVVGPYVVLGPVRSQGPGPVRPVVLLAVLVPTS